MNLRRHFQYFSLSRKERIGFMSFLLVTTFVYCYPYLFSKRTDSSLLQASPELWAAIDTLATRQQQMNEAEEEKGFIAYEPKAVEDFEKGALFYFDPNTASAADWKRLGLNERTIKTILNYRTKGGRFYKKEDLKKIWGLPEGFYERVVNYIVIHSDNNQAKLTANTLGKAERRIDLIHLNTADTATLIALPGIGSKLAARIVTFREKLGGFYSIDQVAETYGLPDSTFQKIKSYLKLDGAVKKININTASKDDLKAHPYIRWQLANAIVEYRNQHGPYNQVEALKNINLFTEELFNKLKPYLSTE